ncbi:MAG: FAD-dependent oxidoreductase, partial [Actinomycetota bacterium]
MPSDAVLVIGGGPGGLEAARGIIELGTRCILVEAHDRLGGMPIIENYAALTPHFEPAETAMQTMIDRIASSPLLDLRLRTMVTAQEGSPGDFRVTLTDPSGATDVVECGAVVIATGFQHFDPGRETQMYGYYEFPDVIALQDLEAMLKEHNVVRPSNGERPTRLCFIQCVGSRDRRLGNEYCSKVCCGVASKEAIEVRQQLPDCRVYIFYIDMRMYGYWENQIYWPAQEQYKVQYIKGIVTEILRKGDKLLVRGEDTTMGRPMEV